ncbi:uncharacterized protein moto [Cheilinus undulatus]|uniref:uncharacterized protein moto n=1 Tax=Cheilinus undulatus TaxID=241271 RepID=UPI001BD26081|nr:uncharacterized protein moto [Cheilinus undulatus]
MAFDRHPSASAYSLFPSLQRQASGSGGVGNTGNLASTAVSHPSVLMQEQLRPSIIHHQGAHEDPFGLVSCALSNAKSRKPTDNTDCDGETGLQHLVSNILDEADLQDNFFSNGSHPTSNPVWSPLAEELLEYSQTEAKTQPNYIFPINHATFEALGKTQGQSVYKDLEKFVQHHNGITANQQWLLNLPNGDGDSYAQPPKKQPSGQPVPNTRDNYLSQIQQSKHGCTVPFKDRGNGQQKNHFPNLSNILRSESEKSGLCSPPYYENHFNRSSAKTSTNDEYTEKDINQLVNSLQSFMSVEDDGLYCGDFPNMQRQSMPMHYDDTMGEQCKITTPAMSLPSTPGLQAQRPLGRKFESEWMERNGGANNQTLNYHALLDLPGVSPQNTDHFEQQNSIFASSYCQNQHLNKMTMHRQNASIPNISINKFTKQHIQQARMEGKTKPAMQEQKKRNLMSTFLREGIPATTSPTSTDLRGDDRQGLSQNPFFEPMENLQFKRSDEENSIFGVGNTQQLLPLICPVNDLRRMSSVAINSSNNFSSRSTLCYGRAAPCMDTVDMWSASDWSFKSSANVTMAHNRENTYHCVAPTMTTSMMMHQGGPVFQLNLILDECFEQWKCLEKEREKAQAILSMTFHGKKTAAVINTNMCKTPANPSRVDHLIVKQMREQARVASLLDKMESLHNISFHTNIHTILNMHNTAVCITQARRKEEIANMSKHKSQRAHFTEERDTVLLAVALKDLAVTTRKLRTALWCAHQMTLPKPVRKQEQQAAQDATHTRRSPSPFKGYSF